MKNNIKVLIVDDEEIVVRGIKKGLEAKHQFDVQIVLDGNAAIKMAAKEFFDVVVVDLVMPDLDGLETCKGIKKVSPKTEVLMLSGYPAEAARLQSDFVKSGGNDLFLRKPLLAEEVYEAIMEVLKKK